MKKNESVASRDFGKEETNNNDREILSHEAVMPPPKKRIYNPVTGKYYEVQQRTTEIRRRGQIRGSWSSKQK